MNDPYRNTDPATFQDDVRSLREDFEETRAFVAQSRQEVGALNSRLCSIKVFLYPFVPVALGLVLGFAVLAFHIKDDQQTIETLQLDVQRLQIDRDRQDAVAKALVWELYNIWEPGSERGCQCDFGEGGLR